MERSRPAALFDRDGVLVQAVVHEGRPHPAPTPEEMRLDEHAVEAVGRLSGAGFALAVVTNQPDVARGTTAESEVHRANALIADALGLARQAFFTCFHDDGHGCGCRKPAPGLLTTAADALGADLGASTVVGDRWRDIGAAQRAGCRGVWIDRGYDEPAPSEPYERVTSLAEAVDRILVG